jgi:hypothetical protein
VDEIISTLKEMTSLGRRDMINRYATDTCNLIRDCVDKKSKPVNTTIAKVPRSRFH